MYNATDKNAQALTWLPYRVGASLLYNPLDMNISNRIKVILAAYDAGDISISKMESTIKGVFTAFHYDETQHRSEVLNTIDPVKDDGPKWNDFIGTEDNDKKDLFDAITEEGEKMLFVVDDDRYSITLRRLIEVNDIGNLSPHDISRLQLLEVNTELCFGLGADVKRVM